MNRHLIITMVIDTYDTNTNGTTISTKRFTELLRERGNTVNIITGSLANDKYTYSTGYNKFPGLYQLSKHQGMFIAKNNNKILREVISQSDIIHFLLPFRLQKKGKRIADKLNIPSTAAFHVQPENITSTLYLNKFEKINGLIYRYFRRYYNKFDHVHCPSKMIANKLSEQNYSANLHVISNGVAPIFIPKEIRKPDKFNNHYIILMIGRLSREKRQDLIISAVKKLPFEKEVQIVFAGQGPWKRILEEESEGLTNPPIFDFFTQSDLHDLINYSDLYIHASDVEIEAISCMEAFSCGLVPIISDSDNSATNQFALCENNLFKANDSDDLSKKIAYLYNNPQVVEDLSKRYIDYAKIYHLEKSVDKIENMFHETIKEHNNGNDKI